MGKVPGSPPAWALSTSHCHFRWDSTCTDRNLYPALLWRAVGLSEILYPFWHRAWRATLGCSLRGPYWLQRRQNKHIRKTEKNMLTNNYKYKDRLCGFEYGLGGGAHAGAHTCHLRLDTKCLSYLKELCLNLGVCHFLAATWPSGP